MLGDPSLQFVQGNGDVLVPVHIGNNYSVATLNTASGTSSTTLLTGAPGYIVTQLGFQCDATATLAAGGMESITLTDSSFGTIASFRIYIPAAVTLPVVATPIRQVNEGPFVWKNSVANSTLSVALGTALTAGSIRVFVRYALTQSLG